MPYLNFSAKKYVDFTQFDASQLPVGTKIQDAGSGAYYTLTVSSHVLDSNHIAVLGNVGLRWVKDAPPSFTVPSSVITVSPTGDDANDGVTRPVKTIVQGLILLQAAGGGTLEYEDGCWASNVLGGGVKLRGPSDQGTGDDGAGSPWVTITWPTMFRPSGNPQHAPQATGSSFIKPGLGAADFIEPNLWIAGTNTSIQFDSTYFYTAQPGSIPAVRLGLTSPLPAWNAGTTYNLNSSVTFGGVPYDCINSGSINEQPNTHPGSWQPSRPSSINSDLLAGCYTSNLLFTRCTFERDGLNTGPCVDNGTSFWVYYEHCALTRPGADSTNPIFNCAIRYPFTQRGTSYLQFFDKVNFAGTGIYSTGDSEGVIRTAFLENAETPVLTLVNDPDTSGGTYIARGNWHVEDAQVTDSPLVPPENRAVNNQSGSQVFARFCNPCSGRVKVYDPVTENQSPNTANSFLYGEAGALVMLQQDSSRRTFGPSAAEFPNVAWQPVGSLTATTAPDGSNTAALVPDSAHRHYLFDDGTAPQVLADGDRMIFGSWIRWDHAAYTGTYIINNGSGNLTLFLGGYYINSNQQVTLAPNQAVQWIVDEPSADTGQWVWNWAWLKVISRGSGRVRISCSPDGGGAVWRCNAQIIPASATALTDPEVAAMAIHQQPPPNIRKSGSPDTIVSPAAGSWSVWPGMKRGFWDATLGAWKYLDIDNGVIRIT